MVGQGALRECQLDPDVQSVLTFVRQASPASGARELVSPKVREIVVPDLRNLSAYESELAACDACFFCIGVSSAGLSEEAYRKVTYDLAVSVAKTLVRIRPEMTFIFVSGASTDSTEKGPVMWARVKGAAENAILALPFKGKYAIRPAFIQPEHGIRSRTAMYNVLYVLLRPFVPLVKRIFPGKATTTSRLGRAMLYLARYGAAKPVLESADLDAMADLAPP
jgi:uncharacterized protein YbjT (DUF2867 family)